MRSPGPYWAFEDGEPFVVFMNEKRDWYRFRFDWDGHPIIEAIAFNTDNPPMAIHSKILNPRAKE